MVRLEATNFGKIPEDGKSGKFVTRKNGDIHVGSSSLFHEQIAINDRVPLHDLVDAGQVTWEDDTQIFSGGSAGLNLPPTGKEIENRSITRAGVTHLSEVTGIPADVQEDTIVEFRRARREEALKLETVQPDELERARELVDEVYKGGAGRIYDLMNPRSQNAYDLLKGFDTDKNLEFAFGEPVERQEFTEFANAFPFPTAVKVERGNYFPRDRQLLFNSAFKSPFAWRTVERTIETPGITIFGREFFKKQETVEDDVKVPYLFKGRQGSDGWRTYVYVMPDREWYDSGSHPHAYAMQLIVPPDIADKLNTIIDNRMDESFEAQIGWHALFMAMHEKLVGDNSPLNERPRKTTSLGVVDDRPEAFIQTIVS